MKTLALISIAMTAAMAGQADAKSAWTEMTMGTFKSRCVEGGGTLAALSGKRVKCSSSTGMHITCIDTKGFGITCDWNTVASGTPSILRAGGDSGFGTPPGNGPAAGGSGGDGGGGDADSGGEGDESAE